MGSPLGPLLTNVFTCHIKETLQQQGKLPSYHRRYVDDTFTIKPDRKAAENFLKTLNTCHSSLRFTMKLEANSVLPFLGVSLVNGAPMINTKFYVKPTNTGLLLHHQSHVDMRYKKSLIKTMLDRAYRISSNWSLFSDECDRLRQMFSNLNYPRHLIDSAIKRFIDSKVTLQTQPVSSASQDVIETIRITLPFKDQKSANSVKQYA